LRFYALDGSVDIGAFDIELGGMILIDIWRAFEQLRPIFIIHCFAEYILHMFSLRCQFADLHLDTRIPRTVFLTYIDGISRAMSEDLVDHLQFACVDD
jgi:hypothetical protein